MEIWTKDQCTPGTATVARISVQGKMVIAVGILETKVAIAVCGDVGAKDQAESESNAYRIAKDWYSTSDLYTAHELRDAREYMTHDDFMAFVKKHGFTCDHRVSNQRILANRFVDEYTSRAMSKARGE